MKPWILWALFILYSVAMVVVSIIKTGREKDGDEYWNAKKDLAWWQLAISLTAGWLMLGWIGFGMGQIYMLGATGLWILPIPWLVLCVLLVFLVPLYRKVPFYSIADAFQKRFGANARVLIGFFSLGVFLCWTGAELFMVKKLVGQNMALPANTEWLLLFLFVLPIMIYTYWGGFRAVVFTDVCQFCIMVAFMIILLAFALHYTSGVAGGKSLLEAVRASRPPWLAEGKSVFGFWNMGLIFPIALFLGYLPGWLIEQDLWQRLQAAKSTGDARKTAWGGLFLIATFVIVIPSVVGFLSLVAFPPEAGKEAMAVGGAGQMAVGIIPAFIAKMPSLLAYLMFLGVLACQMSTVDTFANVSAMALANDILGKKGQAGLRVGKIMSVVVLFLAFLYAVIADKLGDVYYISSGVLSASIAVPLIAYGWKRMSAAAVFAASTAGALSAIGFYLLEYKVWKLTAPASLSLLSNSIGYNYLGACVLTSALVLVVMTILVPNKRT
jgi:SSS family solute:Na+ symporter